MRLVITSALTFGCSALLSFSAPPVIDDTTLTKGLGDKIGKLCTAKKATPSRELMKQLSRKSTKLSLPEPNKVKREDLYADTVGSVGIITSAYKCNKCPHWHRAGCATCWVLTEEGVMVTNYHVFENIKQEGFGVLTINGKVSPVTEILAADKAADIAIFKVAGTGFKPLKLGKAQKVGGVAHIIAHPDSRFFTYTSGVVSRYYKDRAKRPVYWMGVTAEYARGSSGGPVMDDAGNVIGMVASTNSIYYPSKDKSKRGPFQMVIRNCVPVDAIRKLITR